MVTLYIGMDDHFQQYQEEYGGTLNEQGMVPAEGVVAEMAELTGWNLDLAGEITTGKGGITVTFGENCALFSGPPQEQKDEFRVYDSYQLDETILDSVKKTLQNWAVVPGQGDPDSVDVYYCGPDGKDLVLINSGWTISSTQPYEQFPQGQLTIHVKKTRRTLKVRRVCRFKTDYREKVSPQVRGMRESPSSSRRRARAASPVQWPVYTRRTLCSLRARAT